MARPIEIDDLAPDFDLTSTEDVVLMLRDEVPRSAVVLYFFADPASERCRADLLALAARQGELAELAVTLLAISPAKLDELKALQRELDLRYPLLTDDRKLSAAYGFELAEEGEEGDTEPALVVVNRRQRVIWAANPVESVAESLGAVEKALRKLPSSTVNYPRRATNWLVDRWVNQKTGLRKRRA